MSRMVYALMLWFKVSVAAFAAMDRLHLRDDSLVSGSIMAQDKNGYCIMISTPRGPAVTNVAYHSVRYVEYATPDRARLWLQADETARALGARTAAHVIILATEPFGEAILEAAQNA